MRIRVRHAIHQVLAGNAKHSSDIWILGFFLLAYLVLTVRGRYGFNDDYVVVGQIAQSDMGMRDVWNWASSPYSSGRFAAILLIAIASPLLAAIDGLQILRMIGAIGWALVSMRLCVELRRFKVTRVFSIVLSLVPIFVPGSQLTLISGSNFYYSWGTLLAIWISGRIANLEKSSYKIPVALIFLGLIPTMFYQPISAFLILLPAVSWSLWRNNNQKRRNFIWGIAIYLISILMNWLIVKLFYSSSRLEGNLDFGNKMNTFLFETLSISILPHLYIINADVARKCYPLVLLLSVLFFFLNIRSLQMNVFRGVTNTCLEICLLTGLLPLTLGWLFLIAEDGVNFRKVFWGSSSWLILFLLSLNKAFINNNRFMGYVGLIIMLSALLLWALFFRYTTVHLQQKEWDSAICASRQVKLTPESDLSLDYLLPSDPRDKFLYKDEIAVHSLAFPGPQTFLPWLGNLEAQPDNIIPNAWGIHSSTKGSGEGRDWTREFNSCWNNPR